MGFALALGALGRAETPHYFIAEHNEPAHGVGNGAAIAGAYEVLRGMAARADEGGVRLTLMFSAQIKP